MNFKNQRIIVEIQGLVYGIQTLFFEIKSEEQFLNFKDYFVWLRITDEGSVPEMRIWSIL